MALLVRNPSNGPAVFEHDKDNTFRWAPSGDDFGEDLQQLPDDVANNPRFVRAIKKGVLKIEQTDLDIAAMMKDATDEHMLREKERESTALSAVEDPTANDVVLRKGDCTGCTRNVLVRVSDLGKRPNLCEGCPKDPSDFTAVIDGDTIKWNETKEP